MVTSTSMFEGLRGPVATSCALWRLTSACEIDDDDTAFSGNLTAPWRTRMTCRNRGDIPYQSRGSQNTDIFINTNWGLYVCVKVEPTLKNVLFVDRRTRPTVSEEWVIYWFISGTTVHRFAGSVVAVQW